MVSCGILLVLIREFKRFVERYPYRESVVSNCVLMVPYVRNNHDGMQFRFSFIIYPTLISDIEGFRVRIVNDSKSLYVLASPGEDSYIRPDRFDRTSENYSKIIIKDIPIEIQKNTESTAICASFGYDGFRYEIYYIDKQNDMEANYGEVIKMISSMLKEPF